MSVLIKGMEMPVNCCHCPLIGYDPDIEWSDGGRESHGAYVCVLTHELIDNTKCEEHCPLVQVPPHGRLIDADALYKSFGASGNCNKCDLDAYKCQYYNEHTMMEFCELIDDAPTIIDAERQ